MAGGDGGRRWRAAMAGGDGRIHIAASFTFTPVFIADYDICILSALSSAEPIFSALKQNTDIEVKSTNIAYLFHPSS